MTEKEIEQIIIENCEIGQDNTGLPLFILNDDTMKEASREILILLKG